MLSPSRPCGRPELLALAATALLALAPAAAAVPVPADRATVLEILDGQDLWIERRRARVRDRAVAPELLRTGSSRAMLAFRADAAARMNRASQLRLGSRCFLLERGQILLSGPQTLCTRSARLSVRGTHVLLEVDPGGAATVSVLEGRVDVETSGAAAALTSVGQGQRLRLGPDGRVLALEPLPASVLRAFVDGPLVDGFTTPLPGQSELERSLASASPGLSLACAAQPETSLVAGVNGLRWQRGRPALQPLPSPLVARNCRYLAPVLRRILNGGDCDHDRDRWQALLAERRQPGALSPVSELIACPGPWPMDTAGVLKRWLASPLHSDLLLQRPRASHLDCVRLTLSGQTAAVCTTWGVTPIGGGATAQFP